jgi:hypothetical protein
MLPRNGVGKAIGSKGSRKNNFTFCGSVSTPGFCRKIGIGSQILASLPPCGARRQSRAARGILDDVTHRLRRGALHLPARRSRQNVNLLLREP